MLAVSFLSYDKSVCTVLRVILVEFLFCGFSVLNSICMVDTLFWIDPLIITPTKITRYVVHVHILYQEYIPFTILKLTSRVQTLAEVVAAVELFPSHGMGGSMGVAS